MKGEYEFYQITIVLVHLLVNGVGAKFEIRLVWIHQRLLLVYHRCAQNNIGVGGSTKYLCGSTL